MSKHTPGPWVWGVWNIHAEDRERHHQGDPLLWTLDPAKAGDPAEFYQGPYGRKAAMPGGFVVEALGYETEGLECENADISLITAAPDLLAAVKALLAGEQEMAVEDIIQMAEAAVAKAEGRK